MADVLIYTTQFCPFCIRAKMLLNEKKVRFQEIKVDNNPAMRREMAEKAGQTSVPQIWINGVHVGGCDQLYLLEKKGELDGLLGQKGEM